MKKLLLLLSIFMTTQVYAKGMMAHNPYVRLLPPTAKTTGAFMILMNHSDEDRKLVSAHSEVSKKTEIHNHIKENGMMKMREVDHILIKKNEKVELKPGSYHIMLIGLKSPLKKGQEISIELKFDDGETIKVKAPVKKIGKGMKKMKHHNH